MRPYQISVCGDSAINIVVADTISAEASALVRSAAARIQAAGIAGIEDIVPTFCAVMVAYNPETISYEELVSAVHANLDGLSAEGASAGKTIVIPVCYGGEFGPDLEHVAQFHGITPDEVVRLHTEPTYLIAMLGFLPGFAYLSGLNPDLETPVSKCRACASKPALWALAARKRASTPCPRPADGKSSAAARCAPTTQNASRRFCMPRAIPLNSRPFPPMNMRKSRPRCRLEPTNTA